MWESAGERAAEYCGGDGVPEGRITIPNEIAQNLKAAEDGLSARYDASARNLVAEKPVLAYILKSALDEYEGYTIQEIAGKFIEGVPQIRTAARNARLLYPLCLPCPLGQGKRQREKMLQTE